MAEITAAPGPSSSSPAQGPISQHFLSPALAQVTACLPSRPEAEPHPVGLTCSAECGKVTGCQAALSPDLRAVPLILAPQEMRFSTPTPPAPQALTVDFQALRACETGIQVTAHWTSLPWNFPPFIWPAHVEQLQSKWQEGHINQIQPFGLSQKRAIHVG